MIRPRCWILCWIRFEIGRRLIPNDTPASNAPAALMPARPVPRRHWRSYGDHTLPFGAEALDKPLRAFPSWFLRVVCERCGKERMVNEAHMARGEMRIRDILDRMRHDGCGGRPEKAELLTGIEGASSRPVRRIVLPVRA
jgi:hypothetical protein